MPTKSADVVVAGHICLDVIPTLAARPGDALLAPGTLTLVGPAVIATGGPVANVGLALHRLGVPVRLVGRVGDDLFGRAVLDLLRGHDPALADHMRVVPGAPTSYTVVISRPGVDRTFLHCPGANDTFGADDVPDKVLAAARLLHFGYPPVMRRLYSDGGRELEIMLRRAKVHGLTTSLDMTLPDPDSAAGRVDWPAWLARVLPQVDLFLPSAEEILFMLDRAQFNRLARVTGPAGVLSRLYGVRLHALAEELVHLGVALVALKLGDQGLYLRTTADAGRLPALLPATAWQGRELLAPCFRVRVVGTTGAGDCTIAGFLAGLLRGRPPAAVMTSAVAVGACNVEAADATSGVPSWADVQRRIRTGWERLPVTLPLPGWRWHAGQGLWIGPHDTGGEIC